MGFFAAHEVSQERPVSLIPKCGLCKLYADCKSPKMPVTGNGKRKILILAEAPGHTEDERGIQFCGKSGRYLENLLFEHGIDMRQDCWLTNSLICRPPRNASPTDRQLLWCYPNYARTIQELKPDIVIAMGLPSVKTALHDIWLDTFGSMAQWAGWKIPVIKYNHWVCPVFHPAHIIREIEHPNGLIYETVFRKQLKAISKLQGKPFAEVPDYAKQVSVITEPNGVIQKLQNYESEGGNVAFDFETTSIKPEGANHEIVAASVCYAGQETISFPVYGDISAALGAFLRGENPKIGHNIKFEDRWTRIIFKHGVRNWYWCTQTAAHVLDNRSGITNLGFQVLVNLGMGTWDSSIKTYLSTTDSVGINRAKEADLHKLCLYCGLDSLLTYKLAEIQCRKLL